MRHLPRPMPRAARRATSHLARAASLALASLALAACGGGGDGGPDVGTPSRIEQVGAAPTGTVDAVVTPAPSVKVTDANGRGVPNVSVTFTANGGGSATDGTQRTNAQGVATVGSWKLGTIAGTGNTLTATSGTLSTTIAATATAAAAAIHQPAPGQPASQNVQPNGVVAVRPAVRVTDGYGNPKPGMAVVFTASANSGTVTLPAQTTNSDGIATVGSWTVGSATGQQTLVASVTGAALPSVTFVANVAVGNPDACVGTPYTLGTTVTGTLTLNDCPLGDGSVLDIYQITSASQINHDFRLASTAFNAYIWITTPDGRMLLADADDESEATSNARVHFIAPPGSYAFLANGYENETGPYTLSSSGAARAAGCDQDAWLVPGVAFTESIAATDCADLNVTGTYGDGYLMWLPAGRTTTVTMRSSAVNSYLIVVRATETGGTLQGENDNGAGGNDARLTFTAPAGASPSLYLILATTAAANSTGGAYTLDVTAPAGLQAGAPVRAPASGPMPIGPGLQKGVVSPWLSTPWGATFRHGAMRSR